MRLVIFLCTLFLISPAFSAAPPPQVGEYVEKLVNQVSTMLVDSKLSDADKIKKSKELISKNLDFEWMSKFAIGRAKLSPDQQNQYKSAYSEYMINTYSSLVKNYNGEKTIIKSVSEVDAGEYMVATSVAKPNGQPPIKVQYFIRNLEKGADKFNLKISDIITEGISQLTSQQSEFKSIMDNGGFEPLITHLKDKISK